MTSLKTTRAQRISIIALIAFAGASAVFGVGQVRQHHQLVRASYDLGEVTESLRKAEKANRQLRLERSLLSSPDRLERLAEEIGLVHPAPSQIRVLERGEP